MGQRIGDRQRQANLLFDKGSAIGAGNRLAAREEGEIAALATILYQVLLQDVQTDIAVFFLKAAHQPRDEGGSGIHGEGDIHDAVFPGIVDLPVDGLQLLEDAVGVIENNDAIFIELDAFALAVEELDLELILQHADGAAERRLGHMQFLRRLCDMFQFRCFFVVTQMCDFHEDTSCNVHIACVLLILVILYILHYRKSMLYFILTWP